LLFYYLCPMTDTEIIAYFVQKELPQTLRIDRATTQLEVKDAVGRNIENIRNDPNDHRSRHRLTRIMEALETPYDGPAIPKL
jgi:hypothetical protein